MTKNPWPRIDAWLAKNAKPVAAQLRGPLLDDDVARLEEAVGASLPPAIAEAYRAHDGASGEHATVFAAVRTPRNAEWIRGMAWLRAADVPKVLRFHRAVAADARDPGDDATITPFRESWLPIAKDAGDNVIVVDVSDGRVRAWDNESGDVTDLAGDFRGWMAALADDMEAGLVAFGDEAEDEDEETELLLLDAPRPPRPEPVQVGPEQAARMMLGVFVERGHVVLAEGEDLGTLVKALAAALGHKSKGKRREQVIALLENDARIEEVFADDDTIGALVEEFA
jgi:cell wall assembly regulator SMI1